MSPIVPMMLRSQLGFIQLGPFQKARCLVVDVERFEQIGVTV